MILKILWAISKELSECKNTNKGIFFKFRGKAGVPNLQIWALQKKELTPKSKDLGLKPYPEI